MTVHFPVDKPLAPIGTKIVDFACERYSDELVEEMMPIWKSHHEEISLYSDIPLSPDLEMYRKADLIGILKIFTVRQEGKLFGYQIFHVYPHPHFSIKAAVQDNLFLSSDLRKGFIGYKFIKWCDAELEYEGVKIVFQNVNKAHKFGVLLERLGYQEHDIIYSRRLNN